MKTLKNFIRLTLLISFGCLMNLSVNGQCHPDDYTALKALYESTDGDNWTNSTGWDVSGENPPTNCDLSNWFGITLDQNGRVTRIYMYNNLLSGYLPSELGLLSELKNLDLFFNRISSTLPSEIGEMSNLEYLRLSSNRIESPLPSSFADLSLLKRLYLDGNLLDGKFPAEIIPLTSLEYLDLRNNGLNGAIPSTIGDLNKLTTLNLSYNQFTGSIPSAISNIHALQYLNLNRNQLTGELPASMANMTNLLSLYLESNLFQDDDIDVLMSIENLRTLSLSNNNFGGEVPTEIENLTQLTALYLRSNQFSGEIPEGISKLINLQTLDLSYNLFEGEVPAFLAALTELRTLNLYSNNLESFAQGVADLPYLSSLNLGYNSLISLPGEIGNLSNLRYLYLNYNELESLPASINNLSLLYYLQLDGNRLDGIPDISDLDRLHFLYIQNNDLLNIHESVASLDNLRYLYLNNNNIESLPADIGNLSGLIYLLLGNNNISSIPNSFSDLSELQLLHLYNNSFEGEIPNELGGLEKLRTLLLYSNAFTCYPASFNDYCGRLTISNVGTNLIPWTEFCTEGDSGTCAEPTCSDGVMNGDETDVDCGGSECERCPCDHPDYDALMAFYDATDGANWSDNTGWGENCEPCDWYGINCNSDGRVVCIDLDGNANCSTGGAQGGNNLNGSIPDEISGISELQFLNLGSNTGLEGELPDGIYQLSELTHLFLLANNLTGSIAQDIENLTKLNWLYLGSNDMSGNIPDEIGEITSLTNLIMFNANFEGQIPDGIGNLPNLRELRLNNNNLSGCIPTSFKSFCETRHPDLRNNPNLDGGGDFEAFCVSDLGQCPIPGCTDPDSHNYNSDADEDDGSCETCFDGFQNGDEEDVDCGGDLCDACDSTCPDLSITALSYDNGTYDVTVTNIGDGPAIIGAAGGIVLQGYWNDQGLPEGQGAGGWLLSDSDNILMPDETYRRIWNNSLGQGYSTLVFVIDRDQKLSECDEDNNLSIITDICTDTTPPVFTGDDNCIAVTGLAPDECSALKTFEFSSYENFVIDNESEITEWVIELGLNPGTGETFPNGVDIQPSGWVSTDTDIDVVFQAGLTFIEIKFRNACGLETSWSDTHCQLDDGRDSGIRIDYRDLVKPIANCQSARRDISDTGMTTILASDLNAGSTDNCTPQDELNFFMRLAGTTTFRSSWNFDCDDIGTHVVEFMVADNSSSTNRETCMTTVTITETEIPDFSCAAVTVVLDDTGNATISPFDMSPTITDDCSGVASVVLDKSSFTCSDVGDHTVRLTVTDDAGNQSFCTNTVTVLEPEDCRVCDDVVPDAVCASGLELSLDADGEVTLTVAQFDGGSTDNCTPQNQLIRKIRVVGSDDQVLRNELIFDCDDIGVHTVELFVYDQSLQFNLSKCTAEITIKDDLAPEITCRQNVLAPAGADGTARITPNMLIASLADNCGSDIATFIDISSLTCADAGEDVSITVTVIDGSGNQSSCVATVRYFGAACSSCSDGIQNGDETDIDCGGPDCPTCPDDTDDDGDGFSENEGDCDDNNPDIYPGVLEYRDADGDGYGNPNESREVCDRFSNIGAANGDYVSQAGDCDDDNPEINPDAFEICGNGIDENCDGSDGICTDEDNDNDGYSALEGDCNDNDPSINPGAEEVCYDGIDNNCDGQIDEKSTFYIDRDGDGYGDVNSRAYDLCLPRLGMVLVAGDCDDRNPSVHPGAEEICGDRLDNDCQKGDASCRKSQPNEAIASSTSESFELEVYPNPFSDLIQLNVDVSKQIESTITIHDVVGRQVRYIPTSLNQGGQTIEIDLSDLNAGVYVLQFKTVTDILSTKKIIKN